MVPCDKLFRFPFPHAHSPPFNAGPPRQPRAFMNTRQRPSLSSFSLFPGAPISPQLNAGTAVGPFIPGTKSPWVHLLNLCLLRRCSPPYSSGLGQEVSSLRFFLALFSPPIPLEPLRPLVFNSQGCFPSPQRGPVFSGVSLSHEDLVDILSFRENPCYSLQSPSVTEPSLRFLSPSLRPPSLLRAFPAIPFSLRFPPAPSIIC